ncbi:MAG: hypothetical protein EOP86_18545, partial [Verrucomicrobiaceae bacterium]
VIADFEGPDYGDWKSTGTAFNAGPASGAALAPLEIVNQAGNGLACSENFEAGNGAGNDAPQGRLTSPEFVLERKYLSFRIGGGDYERHCCLNLLVDGRIAKSATGRNSDRICAASWDVSAWAGKTARLEIVDEASGGWGHMLVDQLVLTDHPEVPPVVTTPVYEEPLRPVYHFTARQWTMDRLNPSMRQEGWINDLNGMIYHDGKYHMFAQRWNKCWLHAVSTDLVHWKEREPAFWEQRLDAGVQSGHCVIDYKNTSGLGRPGGEPPMIAFWSHADNLNHGLTWSSDQGMTWQDYPGNPILEFPERDPKVFWHEPTKKWVMMMYGSGKYHILTSDNLLKWRNENSTIPDAYECPDFFELPVIGGEPGLRKWILIHADGKYSAGIFDGRKFTEETPRHLGDIGHDVFYAAQTFENTATGDGRRIQMAWMRGPQAKLFPDMPFSQQISFPCELTLHQTPEGLRLLRKPVKEIALLEKEPKTWSSHTCQPGAALTLATSGEAYRLEVAFGDLQPVTELKFNLRGGEVILRQRSIEVADGSGTHKNVKADLPRNVEKIEVLLDRRSIEVFVNDGQVSCTLNLYPGGNELAVKAKGGSVTLQSVRLAPLKSIWEKPSK